MFKLGVINFVEISLLIFVAALLVWLGTINGAGLSPDSVGYIKMALRISEGNLEQMGAHWPPLYPALIASGFADSLFENARWLSIVSIISFVIVVWGIVNRALHQSAPWYLRAIVLLLLIANTALLKSYWMTWSEGPFITLLACAIYAFMRYIDAKKQGWLVVLILVLALLPLLRYAGVAFVGAFCLAVYWCSPGQFRTRILTSGIVACFAIFPVILWLFLNYIWYGSAAERSFIYHPIGLETLEQGLSVLGAWVVGSEIKLASAVYFLVLVIGVRVAWITKDPLLGLLILLPFCYLPFLVFSISFIDAYTPLDRRILSPLFLPFVLLLLLILAGQHREIRKGVVTSGIALLMLLMLFLEMPNLNGELSRLIRRGEGYAHISWQYSPSLAFVQSMELQRRVYSNSPEALLVHLGREESALPLLYNPSTSQLNEEFDQQLDAAKADLLQTDGVVILFSQLAWRSYFPTADLLVSDYGFELLTTTADGVILRVAGQ